MTADRVDLRDRARRDADLAPPLTDRQVARLTVLLRPPGKRQTAA